LSDLGFCALQRTLSSAVALAAFFILVFFDAGQGPFRPADIVLIPCDYPRGKIDVRVLACNAALAQGSAMSDMPTQRQVRTTHERRARLIAQMHRQAMETANDLLTQHQAIAASLAKVAKEARHRRIEAIAGAFVVALGCVLALLAMMQ
jgi:hypothetical protein